MFVKLAVKSLIDRKGSITLSLIAMTVSIFVLLSVEHIRFQIKESFSSNLTIIVINNKGGQIFSKLSYSNKNIKDFQKYWITPPKTKIKDLADLHKIKYYKLKLKDIKNKLNKISSYNGIKIIEVIIDASKDNIINPK